MAPNIETIDKLPKPLQKDRVRRTSATAEEQDQEAFKTALRRKMDRDPDDEEQQKKPALIVEIDLTKQKKRKKRQSQESETPADAQSEDDRTDAGDRDESPDPPGHIDLKA